MASSHDNRLEPTDSSADAVALSERFRGRYFYDWFAFALQSDAERRQPYEVQEDLLHVLYGRPANVLLVGVAGAACGLFAEYRQGQTLALIFALIGLALVLARCRFIVLFRRRFLKTRCHDLGRWFTAFGITAIGSSLAWGALTFVCLAETNDSVLYTIILVSNVATAGATAARNAAASWIARLQLLAMLLPIMAASPFANDRAYECLIVLVPLVIYGLFVLIADINQQLIQSYRSQLKLAALSNIDYLTQIPNRRCFSERSSAALARCSRLREPLAILMIDVDFFKSFNDHYGHQAGDRCLQQVAAILRDNLRHDGDVVSRYGGEEFAVSLQGATECEATTVSQRLCDAVVAAALTHEFRGDGITVVTVSIGVVASTEFHAGLDALIHTADQALYRAKNNGRNQVSLTNRTDVPEPANAACTIQSHRHAAFERISRIGVPWC